MSDEPVIPEGFTRIIFPVDSCSWVALHPADFRQRLREDGLSLLEIASDPSDEDLSDGRLVGLKLGADGWRGVLVGAYPLPAAIAEAIDDKPPFELRLHARHREIYIGDPSHEDRFEPAEADEIATSVRVEPGRYRARLHTMRDATAFGANWVLSLEPVDSFDGLPLWPDLPYEEDEERCPMPPPAAKVRWVSHPKFGRGRVLAAEGEGSSAKLTIAFDSGERRLLASFVQEVEPEP